MLRELLSLFKSEDAVARMAEQFTAMLKLDLELVVMAGELFFDERADDGTRQSILERDIQVNKLERKIRKEVVAHCTLNAEAPSSAYCLLLMSLVKDAERIGDYSKNLSEVRDEGGGPVPDDEVGAELQEIRREVEDILARVGEIIGRSDREEALDRASRGKSISRRCDVLLRRIAAGPYDAATTTTLVLGSRYYKRIAAHIMNILSGVVMPLHKLDFYDEDELTRRIEELQGEE